jgi:hypothetical protein
MMIRWYIYIYIYIVTAVVFRCNETASVVYWSEFLATDAEVPGSIPGATKFSVFHWVWNGDHSAS